MGIDAQIEKIYKDMSGSMAKNRLTIQLSFAIQLIVDLYSVEEFTIFMDCIEDIAVKTVNNEEEKLFMYQVKTKKNGEFSLNYNANNYSIGDEIAASGAYKDRVILAKYYAFLITKLKLASQVVSFPIVIDSPRGDEQDKENAKIIMDFILADKRIDNQVIVATIEGYEFASEGTSVNVIDLKNEKHKLLSSSVYAQYEQSILAALANLSE